MGHSIFYAIENDFIEGVKLILKHKHCDSLCVFDQKCPFKYGVTPLTLAALHNNYPILKLLVNNGHILKVRILLVAG